MVKKIAITTSSDSNEEKIAVAKVDVMMDPSFTSQDEASTFEPSTQDDNNQSSLATLDIFDDADTTSAPLLRKALGGSKKSVSAAITAEPATPLSDTAAETLKIAPKRSNEFDDPKTAAAIDDIVAHESDVVLNSVDQQHSETIEASEPAKTTKHGHPLFWFLVLIICLIAAAMALFLIDPSIHNPLTKVNWNAIRRRL